MLILYESFVMMIAAQGILNKLTMTNVEKLSSDLASLQIDDSLASSSTKRSRRASCTQSFAIR